jgi:hypothetical protein
LRKKEQERKNKIAECKTKIDRTKVTLENRPENVDTSEIDKQIVSPYRRLSARYNSQLPLTWSIDNLDRREAEKASAARESEGY